MVEHGNGRCVRQCVGFNTSTITALAVLEGSGIEYATQSYGGLGEAVCQIDNEPAQLHLVPADLRLVLGVLRLRAAAARGPIRHRACRSRP